MNVTIKPLSKVLGIICCVLLIFSALFALIRLPIMIFIFHFSLNIFEIIYWLPQIASPILMSFAIFLYIKKNKHFNILCTISFCLFAFLLIYEELLGMVVYVDFIINLFKLIFMAFLIVLSLKDFKNRVIVNSLVLIPLLVFFIIEFIPTVELFRWAQYNSFSGDYLIYFYFDKFSEFFFNFPYYISILYIVPKFKTLHGRKKVRTVNIPVNNYENMLIQLKNQYEAGQITLKEYTTKRANIINRI